jgi:hypothetical protein
MSKHQYVITITRQEYELMKANFQEIRHMAGVIIGMDAEKSIIDIWEKEEKRLGNTLEKLVFYREAGKPTHQRRQDDEETRDL